MINKALLIGNIGTDIDHKTANGTPVAEFKLATDEKRSTGEKTTEWHRIVCFGKTAENVRSYAAKGDRIYVEGRIRTRTWDDKTTGQKRERTEIVADVVRMLGSRSRTADSRTADEQPADVPF